MPRADGNVSNGIFGSNPQASDVSADRWMDAYIARCIGNNIQRHIYVEMPIARLTDSLGTV